MAPHRIETIEGNKQSDASHDTLLITVIAFHKIKGDFPGNGDKSRASFIEQMSQMLHPLTCGSANKGDYLLFQMSTINAAIPFITHFPTQGFAFERQGMLATGEPMHYSLKQKSQPACSTWGNDQSATLLLGVTLPTRLRKGEGGKKKQPQALPSWAFYGPRVLRTSTVLHPLRRSYL